MTTEQKTEQTPLLELLTDRGMTQVALAKRIGVDVTALNRWVKRKHKPISVYRRLIAEELRVSEDKIDW